MLENIFDVTMGVVLISLAIVALGIAIAYLKWVLDL